MYSRSKPVVKSKPYKLPSSTQNERRKVIKDLDTVVSEICRRYGADKNGYNTCYTCGARYHWKDMDCGHYIKRRFLNTRWDFKNVNPQCRYCNRTLGGNYGVYEPKIKKELGEDEVLKMWDRAYSNSKLSTTALKIMLETYKKMLKSLDKK